MPLVPSDFSLLALSQYSKGGPPEPAKRSFNDPVCSAKRSSFGFVKGAQMQFFSPLGNHATHLTPYPSFPFFLKARKTSPKTRIFYPHRITGQEGKRRTESKEILARRNNKEIPQNKERKDRAGQLTASLTHAYRTRISGHESVVTPL